MTTLDPVIPNPADQAHARWLLDTHAHATGPRHWDTAWATHRLTRDTNSACAALRRTIPAAAAVDRGTLAYLVGAQTRARYYPQAQHTTTPRTV